MLSIDRSGGITRWIDGQYKKVQLKDVEEKELLLNIAGKLQSIKGMLIFFTTLSILGIVAALIIIIQASSHTYGY